VANIAFCEGLGRPDRHLLKLGHVGIVAYYWLLGEAPLLFKPFALIDAAIFVLFVIAYRSFGQPSSRVSR
jgi:hypothetical protein